MGKRARPLRGFERDLRLDIKSCKNEYDSVEQLVDHLRSSYRKYGSIKLQPFTERVRTILFHLQNPNEEEEVTHSKKKRKKHDGGNEESSSTLTSKLPETDNDGDKLEEGSDLMKFMLRNTYIQQGGNNNTDENGNNINNEHGKNFDDDKLLKGEREGGGSGGMDKPMFKDLGGMDELLEELEMDFILPLDYPHLHNHLGVRPISGILFHGPPGCGKTMLARAIANETGVPFYEVSSTELISGISGASEENIRELFSKAYRTAPSIVFIDEIDAIASKRGNVQKEMEVRVVTQLMKCLEESHRSNSRPGHVLVIGATNNPDAIDPALRRPGRFDLEIKLDIPDENARVQIFSTLMRNLRVEGALDLMKIARTTPGYVGADLVALTKKAGNLALKRIRDTRKCELSRELVDNKDPRKWWRIKPWSPEEMEKLSINMTDFEGATKLVQPSSRREGFSTIPNVKWEDVGGLDSLREEFKDFIVSRIKYPELDMEFGEDIETGFLLYGPSGCGKTLIAKAVANEAGANFIHIEGPEILNKYVGESELAIRTIFTRARACSPCIIFFDEVDALTTKRGKEGGWVVERLLTQLLIELDGGDQRKGVYVIGATNRPEAIDRAFLRPGRFGTPIYVPLPSPDERGLILKAIARKRPIDTSVDLMTIGRDDACKNFSGADLSELMSKAARHARREKFKALATGCGGTSSTIKESHFRRAFDEVSPSVSDKQIEYYQRLSKTWRAS